MRDFKAIINKNDNHLIRYALYQGSDQELLTYIPLACLLIKRYTKEAWKNNTASPEFCLLEYQLTTCLKSLDGYCVQHNQRPDFNVLSWCLKCSMLSLHNDPDLARFIQGNR